MTYVINVLFIASMALVSLGLWMLHPGLFVLAFGLVIGVIAYGLNEGHARSVTEEPQS